MGVRDRGYKVGPTGLPTGLKCEMVMEIENGSGPGARRHKSFTTQRFGLWVVCCQIIIKRNCWINFLFKFRYLFKDHPFLGYTIQVLKTVKIPMRKVLL